jgi:hypothetical protein
MRPLKILAAAGVLAASATMTFAAPMSRSYDDGPVVQVQERCHSDCRRHGGDWIRYNRNCEPRVCREYSDDDYRRDRRDRRDRDSGCVKVGPVWYCGN